MRHRKMLAPISSIKHVVNVENAVIADAARRSVILIVAVAQNVVTDVTHVVEGSIIKAVYIEMWFKGNAAAGTEDKFQFIVEKTVAGVNGATFTQLNNLMTYPNKKNVFFSSQGVVGDLTTASIPILRQWIKIPKGKQRFGLGDSLEVAISSTGATANNCGLAIYKEYK